MRINSFARIAAVALLAAAIAVPSFAARGSADFSRFVAIGDSISAGFGAGSLNERHQVFAPPAIIAQQVGIPLCTPSSSATDPCFALPLISFPGLPNGEIVLGVNAAGQLAPTIIPGAGAPRMAGFQRPYNDLAVPGYTVGAALTLTGAEANSGLGQVILRGLGSEVDQALKLNPTFIMVWLGANDVLGAVSQGNPAGLPSAAAFTAQYNAVLDKLVAGAPNAGLIVGTLPTDFRSLPLTGTLPPVVFDSNFQPVVAGGNQIPLIYLPAGTTTPAPVPPGSVILLSALPAIQTGVGMPPQLKQVPPFSALPNVGTPLTDAQVITPAELTAFQTAVTAFNAAITAAAASHNAAVADINGFYSRIANSFTAPIQVGPFAFNRAFATGGLFAMDGTHFSDIGYILFANEFIKAINANYGTHIPLASITKAFQNNDPETAKAVGIAMTPDVAAQMISIFNSATTSAPTPAPRRHAIH
jgi:lysophospholipase L1-like esterase